MRETATSPGNQLPKMRLVGAEKPGKRPRDRWIVPLLTRFTPTSTPMLQASKSTGLRMEIWLMDSILRTANLMTTLPGQVMDGALQFNSLERLDVYSSCTVWARRGNQHLRLYVQQGINRDPLLLILRRRVRKTSYT